MVRSVWDFTCTQDCGNLGDLFFFGYYQDGPNMFIQDNKTSFFLGLSQSMHFFGLPIYFSNIIIKSKKVKIVVWKTEMTRASGKAKA